MDWLIEAAVVLNGGHRRDALIRLSEILGVSVYTVRRWTTGKFPMPSHQELAVRSLVELTELREKMSQIRLLAGETHG